MTRLRQGYGGGQASDEERVHDTVGDSITRHLSLITFHMPEVQKTVQTGEMTQRFIEFVMMHAQNAALFLGQIPNPKTGEAEINLDLARMFIDQLEMIQEKTRGNLTNEEAMVLRNAVSNLQMAFVEVSGGATSLLATRRTDAAAQPEPPQPASSQPAEQPASGAARANTTDRIKPSPSQNRGRNSPKATGRSSTQLRRNYCRRAPSALRRSAMMT